jgi:hypothetical protein
LREVILSEAKDPARRFVLVPRFASLAQDDLD